MSKLERIENVAIVGATGRLGTYFAQELLKTGLHTVTALTRTDSKGTLPKGVKAAAVDYSSESSLVSALTNQHFLVITTSVFAPPDTHDKLVNAAAKAGVPYIMPNSYGGDFTNPALREDDVIYRTLYSRCSEIENRGMAYVAMVCGFWYEWSLALGDPWFSINIKDRTAVFFDDGKTKINISTWEQCGRGLAALLSLPVAEIDQHYKNKPLRIASFKASQRDMLDSIHRVTGSTDEDWKITYEPSTQRFQDGGEEMKKGIRTGFAKKLYSRMFFQDGTGDYEASEGLTNEALGLPKEDFDECTKRAVGMVESGWSPFHDVQWQGASLADHNP